MQSNRDVALRLFRIVRDIHRTQRRAERVIGDCTKLFGSTGDDLCDVIMEITGAQQQIDRYEDKLIGLGARAVAWCCLEDPYDHFYDEKQDAEEVIDWLITFAKGKFTDYEPTAEAVAEVGVAWGQYPMLADEHNRRRGH